MRKMNNFFRNWILTKMVGFLLFWVQPRRVFKVWQVTAGNRKTSAKHAAHNKLPLEITAHTLRTRKIIDVNVVLLVFVRWWGSPTYSSCRRGGRKSRLFQKWLLSPWTNGLGLLNPCGKVIYWFLSHPKTEFPRGALRNLKRFLNSFNITREKYREVITHAIPHDKVSLNLSSSLTRPGARFQRG